VSRFTATDPNTHQSENIWFTPAEIIKNLGEFDMDVCTVSYRPFNIGKKHIEHDKFQDSLKQKWEGFVWMNPPCGKEIEPFIEKFKEHNNGIALVFARMGTHWMQDWINRGGDIFFLRKRVRFIDRHGSKSTNAGTDSCLLLAGSEAKKRVILSGLDGVFLKENNKPQAQLSNN